MPSKARIAFDENVKDIDRLMEIHEELTGNGAGRRYGVQVLNKSAIVLITSAWEAFIEDLAEEALAHLIASGTPAHLPKRLRKQIAQALQKDADELAVWRLAEDGWQTVLQNRLTELARKRNFDWNTPKTSKVEAFVDETLGLQGITKSWSWNGMAFKQAGDKLDEYVELRGAIAHRGAADRPTTKEKVKDYFAHIKRLVDASDSWVNKEMRKATKTPLF